MLSWLTGKVIAHNMRRLREGDPGPTLAMDADDVRFVFPGRSSFAPGAANKRELAAWLERFASLGLQIHADEVVRSAGASCANTRSTRTPKHRRASTPGSSAPAPSGPPASR